MFVEDLVFLVSGCRKLKRIYGLQSTSAADRMQIIVLLNVRFASADVLVRSYLVNKKRIKEITDIIIV